MSGLADRLVTAAAIALNAGSDQQAMLRHGQDARSTTAAVLRELAKAADSFNGDLRLHGHQRRDLESLAEVIEKGEQG